MAETTEKPKSEEKKPVDIPDLDHTEAIEQDEAAREEIYGNPDFVTDPQAKKPELPPETSASLGTEESLRSPETAKAEAKGETTDLDSLTKDELLELAQERGVSPANASMTKDELKAALEG